MEKVTATVHDKPLALYEYTKSCQRQPVVGFYGSEKLDAVTAAKILENLNHTCAPIREELRARAFDLSYKYTGLDLSQMQVSVTKGVGTQFTLPSGRQLRRISYDEVVVEFTLGEVVCVLHFEKPSPRCRYDMLVFVKDPVFGFPKYSTLEASGYNAERLASRLPDSLKEKFASAGFDFKRYLEESKV